jgi:hypothetical protein
VHDLALVGTIFASGGGATAARILAARAQHGMLVAGELSALQLTFLRSFRAALLVCAACAAIGIGTALVRGVVFPTSLSVVEKKPCIA